MKIVFFLLVSGGITLDLVQGKIFHRAATQ